MININDKSRIIGDYLEINAEILQYQLGGTNFVDKKYRQIVAKSRRKRLLKILDKLRESNYTLTKDNVYELLVAVYNNYPPKGEYENILYSKMNPENVDMIEGVVGYKKDKDKTIYAVIMIDRKENIMDINFKQISPLQEDRYHIRLEELHSDNKKTEEIVTSLNQLLLNLMCKYIEDIIKKY